MPTVPILFVGPTYQSRSLSLDAQRTVNLYPEVAEMRGSRNVMALYGTPGLKSFARCPGSGGIRGMWEVKSSKRVFAVQGTNLYEIFSAGPAVLRGTLNTAATTPISMADNGMQLCVVDGSANGYILTLATNSFQRITDSAFFGADTVTFIDGYFIFNKPDSMVFYTSNLYDGLTYLSTDFGSKEGDTDNIVGLIADHRELWLFGKDTTEVWYNSGDPDFPFQRIDGAFIEHGCTSPYSIAKMDNSMFWLGSDGRGAGMIWRAEGYSPRRISNHAVETAINTYSNLDKAVGYTYQQEGHTFYVINFDTATWVYDAATGFWHERGSLDADGQLTRHRANCHVIGFGRNLVGDYQDGRIYEFDLKTYMDDGNAIPRIRATPYVSNNDEWLFHSSLQLTMQTGVGLDGGVSPGTDVNVMLDWSDDDGGSWSNEHWASGGRIGNRRARVKWNRLGRSYDRIYRVTITDPVPVAIVGASLEVVQ